MEDILMRTSVAAPVSLNMEPHCGPGKEFCFAKSAAGSIFIGATDQPSHRIIRHS
ncbi:hypothetical protein [Mesorhizobium sp. WSM4311]|uniref:hypothetical protein n=1 Tax=Mesorhizobium sp. WSM4311 TaxID=2029410 RepID=UPI001AECF2BB|nr:hypothetical protein [Mesorhizobium sp. WSM4311]